MASSLGFFRVEGVENTAPMVTKICSQLFDRSTALAAEVNSDRVHVDIATDIPDEGTLKCVTTGWRSFCKPQRL